jgi:hypothetical protein
MFGPIALPETRKVKEELGSKYASLVQLPSTSTVICLQAS